MSSDQSAELSGSPSPALCDVRRTDPAAVVRLRTLAADTPDRQIAEILDREGFRSGTGQRFTTNIVKQLRYSYSIPSGCPDGPVASAQGYRADGRCSSKVAADLLQVNISTIAAWCQSGMLDGIQSGPHGPWWIKLTPETIDPLAQADASLVVAAIGLRNQKGADGGAGPPSLNPQPFWKEVQYERHIGVLACSSLEEPSRGRRSAGATNCLRRSATPSVLRKRFAAIAPSCCRRFAGDGWRCASSRRSSMSCFPGRGPTPSRAADRGGALRVLRRTRPLTSAGWTPRESRRLTYRTSSRRAIPRSSAATGSSGGSAREASARLPRPRR